MAAAALRNGISVLYACAYHLPVWRAGVAVTSAVIDADCKAGGTLRRRKPQRDYSYAE